MPGYAYTILAAGWLIWMVPFLLAKRRHQGPKQVDRRARWGVLLVAVAYLHFMAEQLLGETAPRLAGCGFGFFSGARGNSFLDGCTFSRTAVANRRGPEPRP